MRTLRSIAGSWYEVSSKPSRLLSMEGARGLAVLLVFFVHFHALFSSYVRPDGLVFRASEFMGLVGNTGVDLFFVISGYLIYGAIIRRRSSYGKFMRRRVQRIYPTFLAVFVLYLVLSALVPSASKIHGPATTAIVYVVKNLLLLPGIFAVRPIITVAWSLSYEFFFYLVLPLVVVITGARNWRSRWRAVFFAAIGVGYLASAIFLPRSEVRLVMFVCGILLYETLSSERFDLPRHGEAAAIGLFIGSLVIAYLLDTRSVWFTLLPGWMHGRADIQGVPGYQGPYKALVLWVSCFWFTAYAFGYSGWLKRVLSWNPLRYLGNMSYSYYLLHGVTLQGVVLVFHRLVSVRPRSPGLYALMLVTGFCATWVTSSALFLLVEKPFSLAARPAGEHPALAWMKATFARRPGSSAVEAANDAAVEVEQSGRKASSSAAP